MGFSQRFYEPISARYLENLMALQKKVDPRMQAAVIKYLTSPELMRMRGGALVVCKEFSLRDSNFHRQIARLIEMQKHIDVLIEEVSIAREAGNHHAPLSYVEMEASPK